jgi:hypothetical protein
MSAAGTAERAREREREDEEEWDLRARAQQAAKVSMQTIISRPAGEGWKEREWTDIVRLFICCYCCCSSLTIKLMLVLLS